MVAPQNNSEPETGSYGRTANASRPAATLKNRFLVKDDFMMFEVAAVIARVVPTDFKLRKLQSING